MGETHAESIKVMEAELQFCQKATSACRNCCMRKLAFTQFQTRPRVFEYCVCVFQGGLALDYY